MKMSEIAGAVLEPYWSAELAHRREVAKRSFGRARPRRFRIPRRRGLRLPQQGARPVAVA